MMFPSRYLELYFWNNQVGDMDCEAFDLNWDRDLKNVETIEIVLMDYPICDEVAIVTYKGDYPLPLSCPSSCILYITDEDGKVISTTVVYTPNPEYNDLLLADSHKEEARYVLYSEVENINHIDRFIKRENPLDVPDWR